MFKRSTSYVLVFSFSLLFSGCDQSNSSSNKTNSSPVSESPAATSTTTDAVKTAETANTEVKTIAKDTTSSAEFKNPVSAEQAAAGWLTLFDGTSLFGWVPQQAEAWKVVDGTIVTESGDKGFLVSYVPYKDFEMTLEFKADADSNSGIFIRSNKDPKDPTKDCYEINIAGAQPQGFLTGSIVGFAKASQEIKLGEWMTMKIKAIGKQITVSVNDIETVNWTAAEEGFHDEGYILLQRNSGKAAFRNIMLKPVIEQQLYDGSSLAGWHVVPGSQGEFKVSDDKTILVTGGRGFLETDTKFSNFVLQFQSKTNAENLNSGVFFRLDENIEKTLSNGYEFQVHHGKKDGNPLTPMDHGTGGIFKRINARRVIADDKTWVTCTLVANGPDFQTWVNGYPVVAWTDTREPHKNPREGLRLEAGPFSLQAHDPTTNIEFKNIGVTNLK